MKMDINGRIRKGISLFRQGVFLFIDSAEQKRAFVRISKVYHISKKRRHIGRSQKLLREYSHSGLEFEL